MSETIYEQGTFSPLIMGKTKQGTVRSYYRQGGKYVRVGNMVTASIYLIGDFNLSDKPEGGLLIKGLPSHLNATTSLNCPSSVCTAIGYAKKQDYFAAILGDEIEITYMIENGLNESLVFGPDLSNEKFGFGFTITYFLE